MTGLSGVADSTPTARANAAFLTEPPDALTADRLGEAWPEVSARLRRMLGGRGVDATLTDDIVQEVAVRALAKRVPFTDPNDLYRWAATTARRVHIDHLRDGVRLTGDDALVALADGTDVAHTAERRVALGQVFRAMAVMRPRERDAILESLEDREARSPQLLVRRHRARASLRKAVGGVLTTLAGVRLRLRAVEPALRTVAATAALAPVVAVGTAGLFAGGPAAPPPVARVAAVAAPAPARTVAVRVRPARSVAAVPRAVRPVVARPAPAAPVRTAAPPAPDGGRIKAGPAVTEPAKDSGVCAEWDQQAVWCAPSLRRVQPGDV